MPTPVFGATVEKNKLKLEKSLEFGLWCGQFEGKQVEVIVKRKTRIRTTGKPDELGNQNGWYWSTILPVCGKSLGYTSDEMHEVFTAAYAPTTMKRIGNKQFPIRIRTSQMNTIQFTEYTDTIIQAMAEMNIKIPLPNEAV